MKVAVITGASSGMGREFVIQISKKEVFDDGSLPGRRKNWNSSKRRAAAP